MPPKPPDLPVPVFEPPPPVPNPVVRPAHPRGDPPIQLRLPPKAKIESAEDLALVREAGIVGFDEISEFLENDQQRELRGKQRGSGRSDESNSISTDENRRRRRKNRRAGVGE